MQKRPGDLKNNKHASAEALCVSKPRLLMTWLNGTDKENEHKLRGVSSRGNTSAGAVHGPCYMP